MSKYQSISPLVTNNSKIAFAFRDKSNLEKAKGEIEKAFRDLKVTSVEQLLRDGYSHVLFVDNTHSLNYNLVLAGIVGKFGGVPRENVRI